MNPTLEKLRSITATEKLSSCSLDDLSKYSDALCTPNANTHFGSGEFPQICESVRSHLLRAQVQLLQSHVLELHDHITLLNKRNGIIQNCVVALTFAALIVGCVQIYFAYLSNENENNLRSVNTTHNIEPTHQKP